MDTHTPNDCDTAAAPASDGVTTNALMDVVNRYSIGGRWVAPSDRCQIRSIINPATEAEIARVPMATAADVDRAVVAARAAFDEGGWRASSIKDRAALMQRLAVCLADRKEEFAQTISVEVGSPIDFAREHQVGRALEHVTATYDALRTTVMETPFGDRPTNDFLRHEPLGVAALITPWNWPLNQMILKVIGALAAGCTMVLKPSELAPLSGVLLADVLHNALRDAPPGVFNLINGDGPLAGAALCAHPGVDVISFTGSTMTGRAVAKAAAEHVTVTNLELGGKSANILFADCDLETAVRQGVAHCFRNSGQACNGASRMLVDSEIYHEAVALAGQIANETQVAAPDKLGRHLGPVISATQFARVQGLIQAGIDEGALPVAGGLGRPHGLDQGHYVRPTVFADVTSQMRIFREEIFGPVLTMTPFADEADAIQLANASSYGLAGYVQTRDDERALRVARQLDVGMVQINGKSRAPGTPFGGRKWSGYGREAGLAGIRAFQDVKSISGVAFPE